MINAAIAAKLESSIAASMILTKLGTTRPHTLEFSMMENAHLRIRPKEKRKVWILGSGHEERAVTSSQP